MISVGISGYGTIGRRVAHHVSEQSNMNVIGIVKKSSSPEEKTAESKGFDLYSAPNSSELENTEGSIRDLSVESDIIVDCTPSGVGQKNKQIYVDTDTKAIFQGGESPEIADIQYNSYAELFCSGHGTDEIQEKRYAQVVSCNTTGLSRILSVLNNFIQIESVDVTLVRRGGDPDEPTRGPTNDVMPKMNIPSHHGHDVESILPGINVITKAVKVPTNQMHFHSMSIKTKQGVSKQDICDILSRHNRIELLPQEYEIWGAGEFREIAHEKLRPYGSIWENIVWEDSISVENSVGQFSSVELFQSVNQRSIVIPDTIDLIRQMVHEHDVSKSVQITDESLGISCDLF
jgi:glyceraldehyde-3-phosphate dehydrogenase (NAD(P))